MPGVIQSAIAMEVVVAVWSLLAARLGRWRITAPMAVVLASVIAALVIPGSFGAVLDTDVLQPISSARCR
jgi:enhancing lycopene biosynthesis protein 2